jgi:hypothetical protein
MRPRTRTLVVSAAASVAADIVVATLAATSARPTAAADQAAHDVLVAPYRSTHAGMGPELNAVLAGLLDMRPSKDGVGSRFEDRGVTKL